MSDASSPIILNQPAALTLQEFCKHVRISTSMGYKLMRDGKLRSVKVGRRTVIPFKEVQRLLSGEMAK